MLPVLLVVGIVVALAMVQRSGRSAPAAAGAVPQFGAGSDRRTLKAGHRYLWTVYIRPPFPSEAALDQFMTNFEAVQPKETNWEFVDILEATREGQPTEQLRFKATQTKQQTVGLPWEMIAAGGFTVTAEDIQEAK